MLAQKNPQQQSQQQNSSSSLSSPFNFTTNKNVNTIASKAQASANMAAAAFSAISQKASSVISSNSSTSQNPTTIFNNATVLASGSDQSNNSIPFSPFLTNNNISNSTPNKSQKVLNQNNSAKSRSIFSTSSFKGQNNSNYEQNSQMIVNNETTLKVSPQKNTNMNKTDSKSSSNTSIFSSSSFLDLFR